MPGCCGNYQIQLNEQQHAKYSSTVFHPHDMDRSPESGSRALQACLLQALAGKMSCLLEQMISIPGRSRWDSIEHCTGCAQIIVNILIAAATHCTVTKRSRSNIWLGSPLTMEDFDKPVLVPSPLSWQGWLTFQGTEDQSTFI